jgi:4-hydroxybenzoate polyprenyltransferase
MQTKHLPIDIQKAISDYEDDKSNGVVTFTNGEFADTPANAEEWVYSFLVVHIPLDM